MVRKELLISLGQDFNPFLSVTRLPKHYRGNVLVSSRPFQLNDLANGGINLLNIEEICKMAGVRHAILLPHSFEAVRPLRSALGMIDAYLTPLGDSFTVQPRIQLMVEAYGLEYYAPNGALKPDPDPTDTAFFDYFHKRKREPYGLLISPTELEYLQGLNFRFEPM